MKFRLDNFKNNGVINECYKKLYEKYKARIEEVELYDSMKPTELFTEYYIKIKTLEELHEVIKLINLGHMVIHADKWSFKNEDMLITLNICD